jgi:hypothetical protein
MRSNAVHIDRYERYPDIVQIDAKNAEMEINGKRGNAWQRSKITTRIIIPARMINRTARTFLSSKHAFTYRE